MQRLHLTAIVLLGFIITVPTIYASTHGISATLHVPFVENQGQIDASVSHYAPTFAGTLFVMACGELVLNVPTGNNVSEKSVSIRERLIGARETKPFGIDPSPTRINVYRGNNPEKWQTNIPTYQSLSLGEVYPGIQISLRAFARTIEKVFHVAAGANPEAIQIQVTGSRSLRVETNGELTVTTPAGPLSYSSPVAYQEADSGRELVQIAYAAQDDGYSFNIGDYDRSRPLIIDPLLRSTFLGGSANDSPFGIIVPVSGGDVYVSGYTYSADFPTTTGAYQEASAGDQDLFVARLNADLTSLVSATYFGGSSMEYGGSIARHPTTGRVYLAGMTWSEDLPQDPLNLGFQTAHATGNQDAFVTSLDANLVGPPITTYLGGTGDDVGLAVVINTVNGHTNYGDVYVAGKTASTDFPGRDGGFQDALLGLGTDIFVSRISADLAALHQSTYVGGTLADELSADSRGNALAIHPVSGHVYLAGFTQSNTIPGFVGEIMGGFDAIFAHLEADLTELVLGTYITGNQLDMATGLAILPTESSGEPETFIVGSTQSVDYLVVPVQEGLQTTYPGGNFSGFVVGLTEGGMRARSTYLGGNGETRGYGIAADPASGELWVTGETSAGNFPVSADADQAANAGGNDAFVVRLPRDLGTLAYGTYLGGADRDYGVAIHVPEAGKAYLAGSTSSDTLTGAGAASYAQTPAGGGDVFVAAFTSGDTPPPTPVWSLETVGYGDSQDIALGSDGTVHACYINGNNLVYGFRNTDGVWTTTTQFTTDNTQPITDCSIAVDRDSQPHICFVTWPETYTATTEGQRGKLWYSGASSSQGVPEVVFAAWVEGVDGLCAITVDPSGNPTISFRRWDGAVDDDPPHQLMYAYKPSSDSDWIVDPVGENPVWSEDSEYGTYTDLEFNQDEKLSITFTGENGHGLVFSPSFWPPGSGTNQPEWTFDIAARLGTGLQLAKQRTHASGPIICWNLLGSHQGQITLYDEWCGVSIPSMEWRGVIELQDTPGKIDFDSIAGLRWLLAYNDDGVSHLAYRMQRAYEEVPMNVTPNFKYTTIPLSVGRTANEMPDSSLSGCRVALEFGEPIQLLCRDGAEGKIIYAQRNPIDWGLLSVSPRRWSFGDTPWAGSPGPNTDWRVFFVSNIGGDDLTLTSAHIEADEPDLWKLDTTCERASFPGSLVPEGVTAVCVQYTGKEADEATAELIIESDAGVVSVSLVGRFIDSDSDGMADSEEWGPSGMDKTYDGDNDRIPDYEQAHVTSLHSYDGGEYVTFSVMAWVQPEPPINVVALPPPERLDGFIFPWGFYKFVFDVEPGNEAVVTLHLPNLAPGTEPVYWKYGPEVSGEADHWYDFSRDIWDDRPGSYFFPIAGEIHISLRDGQRGDYDLEENGVIIDPGGPAVPIAADADKGGGGGGGGCIISTISK